LSMLFVKPVMGKKSGGKDPRDCPTAPEYADIAKSVLWVKKGSVICFMKTYGATPSSLPEEYEIRYGWYLHMGEWATATYIYYVIVRWIRNETHAYWRGELWNGTRGGEGLIKELTCKIEHSKGKITLKMDAYHYQGKIAWQSDCKLSTASGSWWDLNPDYGLYEY